MAQQVTPIDEFCQGRLGLPELLDRIDRTFVGGNSAEQTALRDSWRKNEFKKLLDQRVLHLIDERIETGYSKSRHDPAPLSDDKTVIIPSPTTLRPGHVLKGRFILEEVLGRGGMGVVYRATDLRKKEAQDRDTNIAIKVLSEDFRQHPDSFRALQREARKAQNLAHPNIITVYDFDREDSLIYLTMEYLSGSSLEKRLKAAKGPLPSDQVFSIVKSLCAALSHAHDNGIVHSDLKPANIFITDSGRVKVIDFGIARAVKRAGPSDNGETTVFDAGRLHALTPAYASVEMIEGREPDARDDVFALGCITYELITGRHPYGRMMATEARASGLVPKRPDALTAKQWRALSETLSLERDSRTPSTEKFASEFLAPAKQSSPLTPIRVGAAAGVAIVALVAIYLVYSNLSRSPSSPQSSPAVAGDSDAAQRAAAAAAKRAAEAEAAKKAEADRLAAAEAARKEAGRQAAAAAKQEADRLAAAEAARKEAERQAAAAAAKQEADRLAAAEAARKEAERQAAAAAAAKQEADRLAATEAARKEAERQAAAAAAKQEADRLAAAEAARKEAERQAAAVAAKQEADRLAAAEAARKEAERQAAQAAKQEADRAAAAEAAKKEAARQAASPAKLEADRAAAVEAAKKEADRKSAEAAKKEADRLAAAEAAKKEADRKAAAAAAAQRTAAARPATTNEQTAALTVPRLSDTAFVGTWCSGTIKIRLTPSEWRFQLPGGAETKLTVTRHEAASDKILLYSTDDRERESVTEFGSFSGDQMTQIRGRLTGVDTWNTYNRVFKKC